MNTQIAIKFFSLFGLNDIPLAPEPILCQPILASSLDYGFDFDDDELGQELSAQLPVNDAESPLPAIPSEEFESRYIWFIS